MHTPHKNPMPPVLLLTLSTLMLLLGLWLFAAAASAGTWLEVACQNPDLSSAPSQAWTTSTAGTSPGFGSGASASCSASSSMYAVLSAAGGGEAVGSEEVLIGSAPAGSSLIGGSLNVSMWADGSGFDANGIAVAYTPSFAYDGSDVFFQCSSGQPPCGTGGSPNTFNGTIAIPESRGGHVYLGAGCGGVSGQSCSEHADQVGAFNAYSLIELHSAQLRFLNSSVPGGSAFTGPLLSPGARGTQDISLTATDPSGPGVYAVMVKLDASTPYNATPDTNSGECVPVATSNGALMFDYNQPCKQSENVTIPVNTTGVVDGQHTLKVIVKDAAGNESTVYDNTITTNNAPANTSAPTILAPAEARAGSHIESHPGTWAAPTGTGTLTYAYQWQDCDQEGQNCKAILSAETASYTPTAADVGHTLRLAVTAADTDGFTTATSTPSSVIAAPQEPSGASNGPGSGGTSGSPTPGAGNPGGASTGTNGAPGTPGAPGAPGAGGSSSSNSSSSAQAGAGAPNGVGASSTASIRLGVPRVIKRAYAKSKPTVRGPLLDAQGQPISGASLDVLQQTTGSGHTQLAARATTSGAGTFEVTIPAGASRLITVAYRAYTQDPLYAATATMLESVGAGIQLHITPHSIQPTGSITLAGTVAGPIPKHGVVVELIVRYLGHWQALVPGHRTKRNGHFSVPYRFQGARGTFPVYARVRGGQAGFPYAKGESQTINVRSH